MVFQLARVGDSMVRNTVVGDIKVRKQVLTQAVTPSTLFGERGMQTDAVSAPELFNHLTFLLSVSGKAEFPSDGFAF